MYPCRKAWWSMRPVNEIPIKITEVKKRDSKITQKQLVFLIIPGLIFLFYIIFFMNQLNTLEDEFLRLWLYIILVIVSFSCTRVAMRWGLDEKMLYNNYVRDKSSDICRCWNILDISKDGRILYTNGHIAYIVKMERSNIIGRPDDFDELHFKEVTATVRKIIMSNYTIKKYSLATTDDNSESFNWLDASRKNIKNTKLRKVVGDIIKYSKSLSTTGCNRYVEYWLIYGKEVKKGQKEEIQKILDDMRTTIYKPAIIEEEDIYKFLKDFYKLRYINYKKCFYRNVPPEQVLKVLKDHIRYRHETKGQYAPMSTEVEIATLKYRASLVQLEETDE